MWLEIVKQLAAFPSAVLTGMDTAGYPFSIRCQPQPDPVTQVLRVSMPTGTNLEPGPAGLLCHKHDERLWNLKSFVVCGRLEQDDQGWFFRPQHLIPGMGMGGLMSGVRFVLNGRRNTRRYLEKRGLPRPQVPWDEVKAMLVQAKQER